VILRGFLRWAKREAFFEDSKRKTWWTEIGINKEKQNQMYLAVAANKKRASAGVDTVT